jgi:hypothetical protein
VKLADHESRREYGRVDRVERLAQHQESVQFSNRIPCIVNAQIDGRVSPRLGGGLSVHDDEYRSLAATYIAARVLRGTHRSKNPFA